MRKKQALTLSIVIPVYNEEHHLRTCLESIQKQTITPDEVIVVDNNSTDKTAAIASSFPFVTLLEEKRQGVVFARDRGFNAAKKELIGRIDADTILPTEWVEYVKRFYQIKSRHNQALTGGAYFYNIRLPRFSGWVQDQIAFRINRLLLGHYITYGSNMVLPRRLWREIKPVVCHRTDIHEDLDIAIHLHRKGYTITYRADFKVGVKMRRVRSNHKELWRNLMLWPHTLKTHGRWTWVFGWLGTVILYGFSPQALFNEWIARVLGKPPLNE